MPFNNLEPASQRNLEKVVAVLEKYGGIIHSLVKHNKENQEQILALRREINTLKEQVRK